MKLLQQPVATGAFWRGAFAGGALLASAGAAICPAALAQTAAPAAESPAQPRQTIELASGWRFHFGDDGDAAARPDFDDKGWDAVTVPHTWNRVGNYGAARAADSDTRQGIGWYRLTLSAPPLARGQRAYLDFAAVSKVADVWVNGVHLGQHRGGFARFRYDVTGVWKPGQDNVIAVRADNSKPAAGTASGETIPLAGDFFVYGGLYRPVTLIIAADVGIDLLDYGGPGVYARAGAISDARAEVKLLTRLRNLGPRAHRLVLTAAIRDGDGREVAHASQPLRLAPGASETTTDMVLPHPHLWNGTADPYLYAVSVELAERGRVIDRVSQPLGLRSFRFDANDGFFLNGKYQKLHGVSRHQARAGDGWALTPQDHAEDMALIREIGANTIRMAHYQHADDWVNEADKAGMAVWEEVPYVTTPSLTGGQGSPELWANAEQQLREMIRQQYNHPSIVMWSVGNEVDSASGFGIAGKEPIKPLALLNHLNEVAHAEDPSRVTTFADCCEEQSMLATAGEQLAGTADLIGYNRYYGWYYPQPLNAGPELAAQMDHFHAKHPGLPMSISEYGAGGAISQHSDNVAAGFLNFTGRPQPEEFESFVHEANWPVIAARPYIFASWAWNMFDFPSGLREEGDSFDLNTKGLVTFDRKVKKDAFYYYKAQWSDQPVLYLTGKRYATRAYPLMDVKAYSNAPRAQLSINGKPLGEVACPERICLWPAVALAPGPNHAVVSASVAGTAVTDETVWIGPDPARGIRIAAGALAGQVITQADGSSERFGSDNFVTGGMPMVLNMGGFGGRRMMALRQVDAPDPSLYDFWREGEAFSYAIPCPNGKWLVTIHSFEPRASAPSSLTMQVTANGRQALAPFNVKDAAGGALKGLSRSFPVTVTDGVLRLAFAGTNGKAVVAAIEITPGPSPHPALMRRIAGLRWWIISMMTMGTVLNYLARSTLSVAAPTLKAQFAMDTRQYSWVVMAFQASYTVMQSVSGSVIDALGARLGFTIFAVAWALANMAHGLATGWPSLALFRGLLGASEAAAIPAGAKTVSEWFPPRERPLATSAFQMGTSVGNMIAPPLVAFCILAWNWRLAFVVTGGLSLAWAMLWWLAYRSPDAHPALSVEERALIAGGRAADDLALKPATRQQVLASRGFWAIAIPRFLAEPAWQTFNFFIPLYLATVWKLDLAHIALWAWLPFLAADVGSLAAGVVPPLLMRPNRLFKRGATLLTSRKLTMTLGAVCMIGPACMALAGSPGLAIALFCVGAFAHQMLNGVLVTLCSDLFDSAAVGTATGMAGTIAWIGGMLFTFVIGASADSYGYNPLFMALAALDAVGAVFLWALLRQAPVRESRLSA